MRKLVKKDGDKMPMIIEEIVRVQRKDSDAFIRIQQERLIRLRKIEQQKKKGQRIQNERIEGTPIVWNPGCKREFVEKIF